MEKRLKLEDYVNKVSKKELIVLLFIIQNPYCRAKKIAYLLELQRSHVYTYLNKLIELSLIRKVTDNKVIKYISEVEL